MYLDDLPYQLPSSSLSNQFNYAAINEFLVVVLNLQGLAFYTQAVNLPGIIMSGESRVHSRFNDVDLVGTTLEYEPLKCTFAVNENFENYAQISEWLTQITFPQDNEQFTTISGKNKALLPGSKNQEKSLQYDLHVIALNSNRQPVIGLEFKDAYPVSLTGLDWDSRDDSVKYFSATATFKYLYYKILKVNANN